MPTEVFYTDEDLMFCRSYDETPNLAEFGYHIHDKYEIYCFASGEAEYLVEGNAYMLKPGSILIMRPSEVHMVRLLSAKPYGRYIINFSDNIIKGIDPEGFFLKAFNQRPLGQKNHYLPSVFTCVSPEKIFNAMSQPASGKEEMRIKVMSFLMLLFQQIYTVFLETEDLSAEVHASEKNLILYINAHLSEELSLARLSKEFYLSESQINRIFKRFTGSSVGVYVQLKRLMNARALIRNGATAVEAAAKSGFNDYSSFYRAYKKRFGTSPRDDISDFRFFKI